MKKILAILLILTMLLSITACQDKVEEPNDAGSNTPSDNTQPNNEPEQEEVSGPPTEPMGRIIYGSDTQLSGNFFTSMWGNNAADAIVKDLIHGYGTIAQTKESEYEVNKTVVKDYKVVKNEDDSKTYTFEIHNDLEFSDGEKITAKNYVFTLLFGSHPEVGDLDANISYGMDFVGYRDYSTRPKEKEEGQINEVFTGVRLLDEYKFSLQIPADKFPNYYELTMIGVSPYPMHVIAPDADVVDDGNGCKITGDFTTEILKKTVLDPETGYRYYPKVSCGPYTLKNFDNATSIAEVVVNPKFKGNYEGVKPLVETIIVKKVSKDTRMNELLAGEVDVLEKTGDGKAIKEGLEHVDNEEISVATYPRNGYGLLHFKCDLGATQFTSVRQAVAYCLDGPEFARQYSGGHAMVVYGCYGVSQIAYKETAATLEKELNKYNYNLDKAKEILINDGWTLNKDGNEYKEGEDDIRYKMVDGELMELAIKHMCSTDNPVSELLVTVLPDAFKEVGMSYETTTVQFPELLEHYRNSVPERMYNMFNLGTSFYPSIDYQYYYSLDPKFYDKYNLNRINDEKLAELSKSLILTEGGDRKTYNEKFVKFQKRWNELLPNIPLYSGIQHEFTSKKLKNYVCTADWSFQNAIIYSYIDQ